MLASCSTVSSALSSALNSADFSPDEAAASAYAALWPTSLRRQREFQVFGGEFLGEQKVEYLRGFFKAFFEIETPVWGGFLAGWPGLPGDECHASRNPSRAHLGRISGVSRV